jgi:DNA modification methylase
MTEKESLYTTATVTSSCRNLSRNGSGTAAIFDLILTDPPYGLKADSTMSKQSGSFYGNAAAPKRHYDATNWDDAPPDDAWLLSLVALAKWSIIFGGNYFDLGPARCILVWDKENGTNAFADAELAWTNLDKPVRLKRHMWNGMLRKNREHRYGHPTQKPLDVIAWALQQAPKECKTVFDPYCGIGTTLLAAKQIGIAAVGIEREEKYCETCALRLQQDVLPLHAPVAESAPSPSPCEVELFK